MKNFYLTVSWLAICSFHVFSQESAEHKHKPIEDSPLIILLKSESSENHYFDSLNLTDFPNNLDIDLIRHTPLSLMQQNLFNQSITIEKISPITINTELGDLVLEGDLKIYPPTNASLIGRNDTLRDLKKFHIQENYFGILNLDTICAYSNTYYSFVDNSSKEIRFEAFSKKRNWLQYGLSQSVDGISINGFKNSNHDIHLSISPNPTILNNVTISYLPWEKGKVNIKIANQEGTLIKDLINEISENKPQEKIIDLGNLSPGTYTVTVYFRNETFSTNLIKL